MVDHRQRVLLFLKLLSSTEAIERFVGSAEPDEIADRLCSLWIDELFVPGLRYRDGLEGDRRASSVRDFEAQFSTSEIALLEQFHRFLELRLEMLPKRRSEETTFPRGDFWQSIIAHAGRVLEEIDPEGIETDEIVDRSAGMWRHDGSSARLKDHCRPY
ncbi:MAG TPA: hypothetical protein VIL33_03925 [Rhodothermia bacterium]